MTTLDLTICFCRLSLEDKETVKRILRVVDGVTGDLDGLSFEPPISSALDPFFEAYSTIPATEREEFADQLRTDTKKVTPEHQNAQQPEIIPFVGKFGGEVGYLAEPSIKKYEAVMLAAYELEQGSVGRPLNRAMIQDILVSAGRPPFSIGGLIRFLRQKNPPILELDKTSDRIFRLTPHGRAEAVKLRASFFDISPSTEAASRGKAL